MSSVRQLITVLILESLLVRSNRISMCRITYSAESVISTYLYGQIGFIYVILQCWVRTFYLYGQPEVDLYVSHYSAESGISICTVK